MTGMAITMTMETTMTKNYAAEKREDEIVRRVIMQEIESYIKEKVHHIRVPTLPDIEVDHLCCLIAEGETEVQ